MSGKAHQMANYGTPTWKPSVYADLQSTHLKIAYLRAFQAVRTTTRIENVELRVGLISSWAGNTGTAGPMRRLRPARVAAHF
jgi:hypothetical protein